MRIIEIKYLNLLILIFKSCYKCFHSNFIILKNLQIPICKSLKIQEIIYNNIKLVKLKSLIFNRNIISFKKTFITRLIKTKLKKIIVVSK